MAQRSFYRLYPNAEFITMKQLCLDQGILLEPLDHKWLKRPRSQDPKIRDNILSVLDDVEHLNTRVCYILRFKLPLDVSD